MGLHTLLHVGACCWELLRKVWNDFRDHWNGYVVQQYWIRLLNSSKIVRATHAHYTWSSKSCGLYPSHDALHVPTLLGVDASVCLLLPTRTQQLPTLLLRPFALSSGANERNNVGQQLLTFLNVTLCCVRLHTLLHVLRKYDTGQTFSYVETDAIILKSQALKNPRLPFHAM